METRFSDVRVTYSSRGIPTFLVEAFHDGLHKHALIRAADRAVLINKSQAISLQWNDAWNKHATAEMWKSDIEKRKSRAIELTSEAQEIIESLKNTLVRGIELDPTFDWEELKNKAPFSNGAPVKPVRPTQPTPPVLPTQFGSGFAFLCFLPFFW